MICLIPTHHRTTRSNMATSPAPILHGLVSAALNNPTHPCLVPKPRLAFFSFEIDEEQVIETMTGDLKRTKASLGESERLDEYVLVSQTLSARGPGLIHVEARQLAPGGHSHTQVRASRGVHPSIKRSAMSSYSHPRPPAVTS